MSNDYSWLLYDWGTLGSHYSRSEMHVSQSSACYPLIITERLNDKAVIMVIMSGFVCALVFRSLIYWFGEILGTINEVC